MKKLMTVLASAATALFAFGDGQSPLSQVDFESYPENAVFDAQKNDSGQDAGENENFWYSTAAAGEIGEISNHVANVTFPSVPDVYANADSNEQYLHIDASAPLFRSAVANTQSGSFTGVDIGEGIYLDTLVQFTAADDEFQTNLDSGDKIAISYVEHEDDVTTDENEAWTNFVIRAGYIGTSEITQKNYKAKLPGAAVFNKDDWHRLTVRTVPNIDGNGNVGFVVYVDQVALVYAVDNETIGTDVELAGVAATVPTSVFPSAVEAGGTGGSTISAASFSGTGAIDDVVITKVTPQFIANSSLVPVSITLGTGVTGVTVTVGQDTINPVDDEATPLVFNLPAGTTSFSLAGTLETGYQNFAVVFAEGDESSEFENGVVSFEGASLAFTVKASRNNFNVFNAQNQQSDGIYETLSQALAAEGVAKIQLAYDYDVAANEGANFAGYTIASDIVLDLAGKTINGGSSNARCLFAATANGSLIVINSVDSDNGKIVYGGSAGVFDGNAGEITIGSKAVTDYGPVIDGPAFGVKGYIWSIYTGKFLASVNTTSGGEFVCSTEDEDAGIDVVDSDSTVKLVSGYWVVTPGDTPQPTTYTLTIPEVTGATAIAKINGTEVTDLTKIASNAEVVVTWTAANGYKITAGATETITMSENKTAATPTVVAITYATLTITPIENCTIVVSNATEEVATGAKFDVDDGVTLTVYRTPAEGYELDGCTAEETIVMTEDRTVTAAVKESGSQPGEKTYPEYIDESAKKSYDEWAQYAGILTDEAFADADKNNLEAYLLNCKLDEVAAAKAAFKFTSISYDADQSKWVTTTTTSYNERTYNGTVEVKSYSDVGCKTPSEDGSFFKAELK